MVNIVAVTFFIVWFLGCFLYDIYVTVKMTKEMEDYVANKGEDNELDE